MYNIQNVLFRVQEILPILCGPGATLEAKKTLDREGA